ncbi:TonB-dependent receptor plug domain-containing protein [Paraglaciecola arctica]|uniref:TonB-dependent receptor plug domain-containing protein n=1 Tax=Paraglaciecola arctica TaxID=1128911 RepID=UPI001C07C622|nr:TonB-dependent receptor [Paraglaciecola arctica]MBU3004650.1 TonB-dependent receptor [Paraglaciecola arctica]
MKKRVFIGAVCTFASALSYADTQTADDTSTVEKITVVGAATNLSITAEDIEQYQANDLADIFRHSPSVSVGGSVGVAQKIYVRGLEDSFLNVTVDGAQQTSTLFHHIGRVTIDPDLLQQIDVQAGAGEATSGPGAIGGSIRFKTKDAEDLLQQDERFGGSVKANYFSNDATRFSGSLYGKLSDTWGVLGYFSTIDRDNMEDGDGNEIYGTAADQDMLFVKASGEIATNHFLSLSVEQREEEGEFSARPNWVVLEGAALYPSEAQRDTYVANYRFAHSAFVDIEATAYQTTSSFRGGRFDWLADIDTFGFDLRNTSETAQHKFVYGVDYRSDEVISGPAAGVTENAEEGSVMGIYAQGYSDLTADLLLSYGVRYDDYDFQQRILLEEYYGEPVTDVASSLQDSEVSLNLGLAYDLSDAWTLSLGYAEAARGKQIGDGFTIDGYLYDGSDIPVVAEDLVPETVQNIEASIEYNANNLNARLSVYDSSLEDVIFEGYEGNSVFNNIGSLDTSGIEFDLAYSWKALDLFLGFSNADTELKPRDGLYSVDYSSIDINGYEFVGLGNSRGNTWVVGADYAIHTDANIGISVTKVDAIDIDTLHQAVDLGWTDGLYRLNKPSYTTVDIYGEWQVSNSILANLAITNVLNEQYIDHSSVGDYSEVFATVVGPQEAGRDIRLSVSYQF